MKENFLFLVIVWGLALPPAQAAKIPVEARKHLNEGALALELATGEEGFKKAAAEFQAAADLAPHWPAPYYNLGVVESKLKDWDNALANYMKYLELAPKAKDAQAVRQEIAGLQARLKQQLDLTEFYGEYYQTFGEDTADPNLNRQWSLFFDENGTGGYYLLIVHNKDGSRLWNDHLTFAADEKGIPRSFDASFNYSPSPGGEAAQAVRVFGSLDWPGSPTYGFPERKGKTVIELAFSCPPNACTYWFMPENKSWRWSGKPANP